MQFFKKTIFSNCQTSPTYLVSTCNASQYLLKMIIQGTVECGRRRRQKILQIKGKNRQGQTKRDNCVFFMACKNISKMVGSTIGSTLWTHMITNVT